MHFDYTKKPKKSEVIVGFINDSNLPFYNDIYSKLALTGDTYDIQFDHDKNISQDILDASLVSHCIILTEEKNPAEITKKYEHLLRKYNCLSLAISYSSKENMQNSRHIIDNLKKEYKKINYLRPDIEIDKFYVSSEQKILDNLVCDTIRIKYIPISLSNDSLVLSEEEIYFFTETSKVIKEYNLYHRDTTDGFISLRKGNGFLITSTKTCKVALDLTRISYVENYDLTNNTLVYAGKYLPSSDVVEAYMVYKINPLLQSIIHTHASDRYTRNERFANKIAIGRHSYGTAALGEEINKIIQPYYDNFFIMQEHGEVFSFTDQNRKSIPTKFRNLLENTY